ncbi:hypothetical protein DPMN_047404 [Dreissena polymorpha]|uniref:Uncharacterized protein n=1 Tax=Dreissena polymorpha TaxID=45954 RepID=A0A9D4I1D9_DREPO|nr:hypothetical protein DPMN_047404 [Dreissena polymorpha]
MSPLAKSEMTGNDDELALCIAVYGWVTAYGLVTWVTGYGWVTVYGYELVTVYGVSTSWLLYTESVRVGNCIRKRVRVGFCIRSDYEWVTVYGVSTSGLMYTDRVRVGYCIRSEYEWVSVYGSKALSANGTKEPRYGITGLNVDSYRTSNSILFTGRLVSYFKPYFVYRSTRIALQTLLCLRLSKRDTTETCEPFLFLIKRHATLRAGTAGTLSSRASYKLGSRDASGE